MPAAGWQSGFRSAYEEPDGGSPAESRLERTRWDDDQADDHPRRDARPWPAALRRFPAPAIAQQGNVAEIIVYGTDPCPRSTDDQVVVCARRPESRALPDSARNCGRTAPASRTNPGPAGRRCWRPSEILASTAVRRLGRAGHTGCLIQVIKEARQQRRQQAEDNKPPQ